MKRPVKRLLIAVAVLGVPRIGHSAPTTGTAALEAFAAGKD